MACGLGAHLQLSAEGILVLLQSDQHLQHCLSTRQSTALILQVHSQVHFPGTRSAGIDRLTALLAAGPLPPPSLPPHLSLLLFLILLREVKTDRPRLDLEIFLVGVLCWEEVGDRVSGLSELQTVVPSESGDSAVVLV